MRVRAPEVTAVELAVEQGGLGTVTLDGTIEPAVSLDPGEAPVEYVDSEGVRGVEEGSDGDDPSNADRR